MATERRGQPVAVVEEALRPPGTEIAPGVVVEDGSSLVMSSFPIDDLHDQPASAAAPVGWQALVVVNGPPLEVWERYVAQLDLDHRASTREACVARAIPAPGSHEEAPEVRFITDAPLPGENQLKCYVERGHTLLSMVVGVERCYPAFDVEPCPWRAMSHLYMRVQPGFSGRERSGVDDLRWDLADPSAADPTPGPVPSGPIVPPRLAEDRAVSRLPAPGERLDDLLDPFLGYAPTAVVPRGGRSLIAPAILIDCNSGLVAVMEVPLEPLDAVRAFEGDDSYSSPMVTGADSSGQPMASGALSQAGGFDMTVVAVERDMKSSIVLVTECGD